MDHLGAQHLFGLVHPEFYESLSRYPISSEYVDLVRQLLPDTWALRRSDVWVHAQRPEAAGGRAPIIQGFKIHVSSAPVHAPQVLRLVVPICVGEGIDFKIAGDPTLLHIMNSKLQARGYAGKFMTIYPPDDETFLALIEQLYEKTKDEPVEGPYILSDRRYRDSRLLFYRYGGFRPPSRLNIDGTTTTFLVSPTGDYVEDQRLPYFHLPDWVSDPFGRADGADAAGDACLKNRFRIEGALAFSNAGGIYHGTDTVTGRSVILKEARPLTNPWTVGERSWDAVDLLAREYDVLLRLADLDFVPTRIDLFQEWEHTFLVEERVDGVNYHDFWAQEAILLAPYIRRSGRVERFVSLFKQVADTLIRMVTAVHERGVLLGDLSPGNVLVDGETLRLSLVDFESAVRADDDADVLSFAARWGTPGFLHPARSTGRELLAEDDLYAAGMLLYSSVVPVTMLFTLNPAAQTVFLDRFVALGVPPEVREVVSSLLRGSAEEALDVLARWEVPAVGDARADR